MRHTALSTLDWFIPNAATSERSEIGLARNFVATHLLGPVLIQTIVVLVFLRDPQPGVACLAMMVSVGAFWLLPFGLRLTRDLRLMALISVELLCIISLTGTSFYGGVNSPFLPWLLVSLMLGLFYLPEHAIRVLTLFGFNIVALIAFHCVYRFPQNLSLSDLEPISWLSMFFATAYMAVMAIYYAGIITMMSKLERETERHRLMAQRLRQARQQAETASHGKSIFLAKMKRQFEHPLLHVVAASEALLDRLGSDRKPEITRIHVTGRKLIDLVQETVDPTRVNSETPATVEEIALDTFLDDLANATLPLVSPYGATLTVDIKRDLDAIRIDPHELRQLLERVLVKAAASARYPAIKVEAARHKTAAEDLVELRIRAFSRGSDKVSSRSNLAPVPNSVSDPEQVEAELEMVQLHCAVLGGTFNVSREPNGVLCFAVDLPASPLVSLPGCL